MPVRTILEPIPAYSWWPFDFRMFLFPISGLIFARWDVNAFERRVDMRFGRAKEYVVLSCFRHT